MSTYGATQVGAYLEQRFSFTFSDDPIVQRLEDHIWEAGRRAQTQRKEVVRIAEGLKEDIGYVLHSVLKPDSAAYEPNSRGDFAAGVRHLNELEQAVQDLVGVHQATLWAVRALRSELPTVLEHTTALGELRELKQHLIGEQGKVTNLLEARENWEKDEAQLRHGLKAARDRVAELEASLAKAHEGQLDR